MSLFVNWLEKMHVDTIITNACSRKKHLRSTCSKCVDVCKSGALVISSQSIEINLKHCTSCGECMIACPHSAIEGMANGREFDKSSLVYNDDFTPSIKELLIYKQRGLTAILIEASSSLNQNWTTALENTNRILSILGEHPLPVILKNKKEAFSRRAFFTNLQNEARKMAKSMAPATWKMEAKEWNLANYYKEFQFFKVELNTEKCTLCQTCFFFCSQKVFEISNEGYVQFSSEKCVGCSDCTDLCLEEAIQITPELQLKTDDHRDFHTKQCDSCQKWFYTFQAEKKKCPICHDRHPDWLSPHG